MKRLTRTVQPPAAQSPRRFPRAKSDRHHQTLTYLVSPRHVPESRRANFTSPTQPSSRGCKKTAGGFVAPLCVYLLPVALTLSRPAVGSFVRLLARPTAHSTGAEGGGTNNARFTKHTSPFRYNMRIRWYTRVATHHFPRLAPCLATIPAFFLASRPTPVARTRDSSTRQSHAPRGAHTQRPNAFCNGDLWRETAEGPHDAQWITPPPASGASLCDSESGRSAGSPPSLSSLFTVTALFLHSRLKRNRPTDWIGSNHKRRVSPRQMSLTREFR